MNEHSIPITAANIKSCPRGNSLSEDLLIVSQRISEARYEACRLSDAIAGCIPENPSRINGSNEGSVLSMNLTVDYMFEQLDKLDEYLRNINRRLWG